MSFTQPNAFVRFFDGAYGPLSNPGETNLSSVGGVLYASYNGGAYAQVSSGALSPIAANSVLANSTGSTAVPVANDVAAMQTLLGIQPNNNVNITGGTITGTTVNGYVPFTEYSTVLGSAAQTVLVTGINGDTDGDYRINGKLIIAANTSVIAFGYNGVTTSLKAFPENFLQGGVSGGRADWAIAGATANPMSFSSGDVIYVNGTLYAKSGHERQILLHFYFDIATDAAGFLHGILTDTVTPITSFSAFNTQANGLNTGSYLRMTAMKSAF